MLAGQQFTPMLEESMVRLGSWLPFAQAAEALSYFRQTPVAASTVRRVTERAGASQVAHEEQLRTTHSVPLEEDPTLQVLSLDGAFVPLVGGHWKEVKTLTVGVVSEPLLEKGDLVVHTRALSYFSRLAEVDAFAELAQVETQRRATAAAQTVLAVADGAAWIQTLLDEWRADAIRILDFPHALGYVAQAGQVVYGVDTPAFQSWFKMQRQTLLGGRPQQVVDALQQLSLAAEEQNLSEAAQTLIDESWSYLRKRLPMIQYAAFQALGYPIGSGAAESANKLIVERRLKGAGMHWDEQNVDPLLALTNLTANGRWSITWPHLAAFRTQQAWQTRLNRRARTTPPPPAPLTPDPEPALPTLPYKPAKDHPWRRFSDRTRPSRAVA